MSKQISEFVWSFSTEIFHRNHFKCRLLSSLSVNHSYIPSDPTTLLGVDFEKSLVLPDQNQLKLIVKMKHRKTHL